MWRSLTDNERHGSSHLPRRWPPIGRNTRLAGGVMIVLPQRCWGLNGFNFCRREPRKDLEQKNRISSRWKKDADSKLTHMPACGNMVLVIAGQGPVILESSIRYHRWSLSRVHPLSPIRRFLRSLPRIPTSLKPLLIDDNFQGSKVDQHRAKSRQRRQQFVRSDVDFSIVEEKSFEPHIAEVEGWLGSGGWRGCTSSWDTGTLFSKTTPKLTYFNH
jgi:hypothetical protein